MTDASRLHERDSRKRERLGRALHFIDPVLPTPRTEVEKAVRKLVGKMFDMKCVYKLHIYDVIEAMEVAYKQGVNDGRA